MSQAGSNTCPDAPSASNRIFAVCLRPCSTMHIAWCSDRLGLTRENCSHTAILSLMSIRSTCSSSAPRSYRRATTVRRVDSGVACRAFASAPTSGRDRRAMAALLGKGVGGFNAAAQHTSRASLASSTGLSQTGHPRSLMVWWDAHAWDTTSVETWIPLLLSERARDIVTGHFIARNDVLIRTLLSTCPTAMR